MKTNRRNAVTLIISTAALVSTLMTTGATLGQTRTAILQTQVAQATVLRQRAIRPKPLHTAITPKVRADVLVVKFREGTRVRERLGLLETDLTDISPAEEQLLQRANLPRQRLFEDLAQINTLVAPNSKRFVKRLFARTDAELDAEKREGENRTGEELADLNLYHRIFIAEANPRETAASSETNLHLFFFFAARDLRFLAGELLGRGFDRGSGTPTSFQAPRTASASVLLSP